MRAITAGVAVVVFVGLILGVRSCAIVPAGHVTVLDIFGSVKSQELYPGLQTANPFARRIEMETRTMQKEEHLAVPTKEGLIAGLDISILYKINPTKAAEIYKTLGVNYDNVFLIPTLRNVGRDVVASYSSEDLYSVNRGKMASDIVEKMGSTCAPRGITVEGVLLRDVKLPDQVKDAIEKKIAAKQQAEQMEYVLQKEKQEAERKKIEANGLSEAQKIISGSLTEEYLQWKYITSLEGLAHSQNTTFVIAPYDQKLIPLLPLTSKENTETKTTKK
jgi:prohibitin 1